MTKLKLLAITTFIIIVSSGCGRSDYTVARVNNNIITTLDVEERISRLPVTYRNLAKKNKADFVDDMVVDILLYNEAMKKNLLKDKELRKVIKEAEKKIVIAKLIKDEVEDKVKISDAEVNDYFNSHSKEFMSEPKYRASHILVLSDEEAKSILDKLKKGADFETLAKEYSKDSTAKRGGDVGYFTKGELIPEFENVCFNLNVKEISPVIKTQFGYHIIKLTDRIPSGPKKIEEVKEDIINILKSARRKELFNKLVADLRKKSKITINDKLVQSVNVADTEDNNNQIE